MAYEAENSVELAVREVLESLGLGLKCVRLDHSLSYPDYRVEQLGRPLFFLEVKELRCVKDTDGPDDFDEYLKGVAWVFDDLSRVLLQHLKKARKQFTNAATLDPANRGIPRVLWFRTELSIAAEDFERSIKGVLELDGVFHDCDPTIRDDAEFQEPLRDIDAFVWQPVNGLMLQGMRQSDRAAPERRSLTFELLKMLSIPLQRQLDGARRSHGLPIWENVPRKLFGDPLW